MSHTDIICNYNAVVTVS